MSLSHCVSMNGGAAESSGCMRAGRGPHVTMRPGCRRTRWSCWSGRPAVPSPGQSCPGLLSSARHFRLAAATAPCSAQPAPTCSKRRPPAIGEPCRRRRRAQMHAELFQQPPPARGASSRSFASITSFRRSGCPPLRTRPAPERASHSASPRASPATRLRRRTLRLRRAVTP